MQLLTGFIRNFSEIMYLAHYSPFAFQIIKELIYKYILYTDRKLVLLMKQWVYRNACHGEFPHTCDECIEQRRFRREEDLARHNRDKHGMV